MNHRGIQSSPSGDSIRCTVSVSSNLIIYAPFITGAKVASLQSLNFTAAYPGRSPLRRVPIPVECRPSPPADVCDNQYMRPGARQVSRNTRRPWCPTDNRGPLCLMHSIWPKMARHRHEGETNNAPTVAERRRSSKLRDLRILRRLRHPRYSLRRPVSCGIEHEAYYSLELTRLFA